MNEDNKIYRFILEAGIKLNARGVTCSTAAIYCYRFLQKLPSDVSDVCPYTVAASCLFLAGKIEEDYMKIRDITNVCYRILHPEAPELEIGDLYWSMRDGIGNMELLLSRTLGFHMSVKHPHTFLLQYTKSILSWIDRDKADKVPIAKTAWSILRDSYVYPKLHNSTKPQIAALAILKLTLNIYGVPVPTDREPWHKTLYSSTSSSELDDFAAALLKHVYEL